MRMARIKVHGRGAVYHCISRIVGGQALLGPQEKEQLRHMLWQQAQFAGLELITYCILNNHFHVLLRVPATVIPTDAQLVERVLGLYGAKHLYAQTVAKSYRLQGTLAEDLRRGLLARMGDLSAYMKELKQRFSKWFNRREDRFGTLWAERFKSVLVEDEPGALVAVAAYIDLNPVRAGWVEDPKDYRWSGYGEAVAGGQAAQRGLAGLSRSGEWAQASQEYRQLLLVKSAVAGQSGKVVLAPEAIERLLKQEGQLSLGQVLRLRVRYFSDGLVLGSSRFVEEVFGEFRDRFGPRRRSGARRMRGLGGVLGDLRVMRDLRVNVVG